MLALDLASDGLALVAYFVQLRRPQTNEKDVVAEIVDLYIDESHQTADPYVRKGTISRGRGWLRVEGAAVTVKTTSVISLAGVIGGALDRASWVSVTGIILWMLLLLLAGGQPPLGTAKGGDSTKVLTAYFVAFTLILVALKVIGWFLHATPVG